MRRKPEFEAQVVGMFKWNEKTLNILNSKKFVGVPSLLENSIEWSAISVRSLLI